jgi:hypothetical protein
MRRDLGASSAVMQDRSRLPPCIAPPGNVGSPVLSSLGHHGDNLLIKAAKAPLSFADKLRIKLPSAVPRYLDFQLTPTFATGGGFRLFFDGLRPAKAHPYRSVVPKVRVGETYSLPVASFLTTIWCCDEFEVRSGHERQSGDIASAKRLDNTFCRGDLFNCFADFQALTGSDCLQLRKTGYHPRSGGSFY